MAALDTILPPSLSYRNPPLTSCSKRDALTLSRTILVLVAFRSGVSPAEGILPTSPPAVAATSRLILILVLLPPWTQQSQPSSSGSTPR